MIIQQTYGVYTLVLNENTDEWTAFRTNDEEKRVIARNEKLSMVKKALDRHDARERAFARTKVFRSSGGWREEEHWLDGEVTSVDDHGQAWVTWSDGRREKCSRGILYLATPENIQLREQWNNLQKEIRDRKNIQERIMSDMTPFVPKGLSQ